MNEMCSLCEIPAAPEYVVAWDAGIGGIVVAKTEKRIVAVLPVGKRNDADENIQYRLCPHACNSRRTVMFNTNCYRCQGIGDAAPLANELHRPIRIIFHKAIRVVLKPKHVAAGP